MGPGSGGGDGGVPGLAVVVGGPPVGTEGTFPPGVVAEGDPGLGLVVDGEAALVVGGEVLGGVVVEEVVLPAGAVVVVVDGRWRSGVVVGGLVDDVVVWAAAGDAAPARAEVAVRASTHIAAATRRAEGTTQSNL